MSLGEPCPSASSTKWKPTSANGWSTFISAFSFQRFSFQMTGLSPLQFVTRDGQFLFILLPSYFLSASRSAFAQVFRRVVGVTPTDFRKTTRRFEFSIAFARVRIVVRTKQGACTEGTSPATLKKTR